MTTLQLGLIAAGVILVVGVVIYNWMQERRVRRKIAAAFTKTGGVDAVDRDPAASSRGAARMEPSLTSRHDGGGDGTDGKPATVAPAVVPANVPRPLEEEEYDRAGDFVAPVDFAPTRPSDPRTELPTIPAPEPVAAAAAAMPPSAPRSAGGDRFLQPDPDIECVVTLQPARPVGAGALAAGLHARVGKPLRWFGRSTPGAPWQRLKSDTAGEFIELAACLLLADRAGAATRPLIDRFLRLVSELAAALPAAFVAPDAQQEVGRGEALDRVCGDLDVQIGLTLLKPGPAAIPGTRLRGVAEAAGFHLADSGRFECVQEDTGAVLYSLQNYRSEPFTVDNLRLTSTPGAVFLLDVPRVVDPVRVFDQMKLAAKRMTQTLDATLVDDNRRPLNDAALAAIRQQVQTTAAALKEIRVEPGSPRALALFGG